jgi:hypothetical protein
MIKIKCSFRTKSLANVKKNHTYRTKITDGTILVFYTQKIINEYSATFYKRK